MKADPEQRHQAGTTRNLASDAQLGGPGKQTLVQSQSYAPATANRGSNGIYASSAMWARGIATAQPPAIATGSNAVPAPSPAVADGDDLVTAKAIVSGYQAAQRALEVGDLPAAVLEHLRHVANVSPEYKAKTAFDTVWCSADSFDQVLDARSRKSPGAYRPIVDMNRRIRNDLGLTGSSKPQLDLSSRPDATYVKSAIQSSLEVLAVHTRSALKALDEADSGDLAGRLRIVERVAGNIGFTAEYAMRFLKNVPVEERASLATSANGAALTIGKVLRWVRSRPGHARLESSLLGTDITGGVKAFDAVLIELHLDTVGEHAEASLTENQRHSVEEEHADFDQALSDAIGAVETVTNLQRRKIELFQHLAVLDDQPEPDFKAALMSAIIEATLSTLIGQFAKALTTAPPQVHLPIAASSVSLPAPPKEPGSGGGLEDLNTALSIKLSSLRAAITARLATPSSGGVDPRKRSLAYFCEAWSAAEETRSQQYVANLGALKKGSTITASELRDMKQLLASQAGTLAQHALEEITKAWAQYLARSRLGTSRVGNDKVTTMQNYFGETKPGGRVFGTTHAGGDGILSITMNVDSGRPRLDPGATKVIGINSELQEHLFRAAGGEFERVELPKELHVVARFARATIALDETNRMRDVLGWEEVQRYVGGLSAAGFWQTWGRNLKVSSK